MADTKFSGFTADTDQLPETLEMVGFAGSANYRVLLPDLRKAVRAIMDQHAGKGYFLLSAEGQSWLKGAGSISQTSMSTNSSVFSWQAQGTSPETYAWEAVDPTASSLAAMNANPSTGLRLGNVGDIMWYLADLLQKATNWPVYIVQTSYSDSDISNFGLIGSEGVAAVQHNTQLAAATAHASFPGSSGEAPDLRFWALGWTNAGAGTAPGVFAEKALAHMIDTEDDNALGWADPNSPLYVMSMPRNSQNEANKSTWLGAQLFCQLAGENVHYVDITQQDEFDDTHQAGDAANYTGEDIFGQFVGLRGSGDPEGCIVYERATATLAEGYVKTTHSAGTPTLSSGQLNFDTDFSTSPMSVSKVRFHYTSNDGNNIPWRNMSPSDILRIEDASSPQNYIEVLISGRASWDAIYPSTPNHAEFTVSGIVSQNGWPVADSTAVTVSVRKITLLGNTVAKDYYTGGEGKAKIPHTLQLDKYADSTFSEYLTETYIVDAASRAPLMPLVAGAVAADKIVHRRYEIETTNATSVGFSSAQLPSGTRIAYECQIDAYRSDGLTASPWTSAAYTRTIRGNAIRGATSALFTGTAINIATASNDPNSPQVSAFLIPFLGGLSGNVKGQTGETWQWTINLWVWDLKQ